MTNDAPTATDSLRVSRRTLAAGMAWAAPVAAAIVAAPAYAASTCGDITAPTLCVTGNTSTTATVTYFITEACTGPVTLLKPTIAFSWSPGGGGGIKTSTARDVLGVAGTSINQTGKVTATVDLKDNSVASKMGELITISITQQYTKANGDTGTFVYTGTVLVAQC